MQNDHYGWATNTIDNQPIDRRKKNTGKTAHTYLYTFSFTVWARAIAPNHLYGERIFLEFVMWLLYKRREYVCATINVRARLAACHIAILARYLFLRQHQFVVAVIIRFAFSQWGPVSAAASILCRSAYSLAKCVCVGFLFAVQFP